MKAFARHRTISELRLLCRDLGVRLDDREHRAHGWDTVVVGGPISRDQDGAAWVIYDLVSGSFHGRTPEGLVFHSSDATHEGAPWFEQLLQLFYAEREPAAGVAP